MKPLTLTLLSFVSVFIIVAAVRGGQEDEMNRILTLASEDNQVMTHLGHLTNNIGARLTGSDNLTSACEWAAETFTSYGLSNVHLEKWGAAPVTFNRGKSSGRIVAPVEAQLTFGTNAWTAGTEGPVEAAAILIPTEPGRELPSESELAGKWALLGPSKLDAKPYLIRAGVAGMVLASEDEYIRTKGDHKAAWQQRPTVPEITLVQSQWRRIQLLLAGGQHVVLEFDVANEFVDREVPLYNVVTDLRGSVKPDEYVIVGAHIDSWDGAVGANDNATGTASVLEAARLLAKAGVKPRRTIRFVLFSGEEQGLLGSRGFVQAHKDEMERTSIMLNMDAGGNYISGIPAPPEIASDVEEAVGLLAHHAGLQLPFVISRTSQTAAATTAGYTSSTASCGPAASAQGACDSTPQAAQKQAASSCCGTSPVQPEASSCDPGSAATGPSADEASSCCEGEGGGGTDAHAFIAAGVPAVMWLQSGEADYRHVHHTQYDHYETVIPQYQRHSAAVIAAAAFGFGNLDRLVSRKGVAVSSATPGAEACCQ